MFILSFTAVLTCFTLWSFKTLPQEKKQTIINRSLLEIILISGACFVLHTLNSEADAPFWFIPPLLEALLIPKIWIASLTFFGKKASGISKVTIFLTALLFIYNFATSFQISLDEFSQQQWVSDLWRTGSLVFIIISALVIVTAGEAALEDPEKDNSFSLLFILTANGYLCFRHFLHFLGVENHSLTVDLLFLVPFVACQFPLIDLWLNAPDAQEEAPKQAIKPSWPPAIIENRTPRQTAAPQILKNAFETDQLHLNCELSATSLAKQMHWPEAKLRKAIKDLDYKNFNDLVNHYRIQETCRHLQDPDRAHIPISTTAMEAGYKSVHVFHRIFKERKGMTPKEFRDHSLASSDCDVA